MRTISSLAVVGFGVALSACSGGYPEETSSIPSSECEDPSETPGCEAENGEHLAPLLAPELGWGDGSPGSVDLTVIYEPQPGKLLEPTDLEFNPAEPAQLWIINRADGSVIIMKNPGARGASWERRRDPAASHFMARPPALAFGVKTEAWGMTWATCGDSDNGGNNFMGPALFSADLSIFAKSTPGGLGSHLDMLHSTTFCRGIAHQEENIYWVFNSAKRSLDKYDFAEDHGPGHDYHEDGKIYRYASNQVAGVAGVPSHIFWNSDDRHLYIADTGNRRIAKLDTESGTLGPSFPGMEPVVVRRRVDGAVITDVVPAGALEAPSGLELHNGLIYVSDNATSRFHAFDRRGRRVRSLDTGLPRGSLAGLTFGPDRKIYFVDMKSSRVYRIDPK